MINTLSIILATN